MHIEEKVALAKSLQIKYKELAVRGDLLESVTIKKQFHVLWLEIIEATDTEIQQRKSIPMSEIKTIVKNMPIEIKRETGINVLDYELVDDNGKMSHHKGGFTLGNLIQFAGSKGAGKSSLIVKMMSGLSLVEKVSWIDFEMGKRKAYKMATQFDNSLKNIYYYDGSRELKDVIDEIKYLYQDGVKHFLVDSAMKIRVEGAKIGYETIGKISGAFAELTSQLDINIYLINQVSQETDKGGGLFMKHGNDSEYDSDYIFFLVKPVMKDCNGKIVMDKDGIVTLDENRRVLICTKNRVDHRLFKADIKKSDIFGYKGIEAEEEIIYEMPNL